MITRLECSDLENHWRIANTHGSLWQLGEDIKEAPRSCRSGGVSFRLDVRLKLIVLVIQ